ncbi:MAG: Indigoidine synthase A like protein-domain-containing protein, partial [Olpidium bornovanus]
MPFPENVETAVKVEETIREGGGVPATVAVLDGKIHVGLTPDLLEKLGKLGKNARKTSRRDLAAVVSQARKKNSQLFSPDGEKRLYGVALGCFDFQIMFDFL